MGSKPLTEETKAKIIELYKQGFSTNKISEELGVSIASAHRVVHAAGILRTMKEAAKLRPAPTEEANRKRSESQKGKLMGAERWTTHKLKEGYDKTTEDFAYILGVIAGDAFVMNKSSNNGVGLESKDEDFVLAFGKAVERQFGLPYYNRFLKGRTITDWRTTFKSYDREDTYQLRVHSVLLRDYLLGLDVQSLIKNFSKECKIAFLRGLWDSEGSVGEYPANSGYFRNFISSTNKKTMDCYHDLLLEVTGIKTTYDYRPDQALSRYYTYNLIDIVKFYDIVQPTIQRKRIIFEQAKAKLAAKQKLSITSPINNTEVVK